MSNLSDFGQSDNEAGSERIERDPCQNEDDVTHGSPRLFVVVSLIASELLWLDQGVDEIDEEPEREQCNYPCHKKLAFGVR
jgi:hypothetical protein